MEQYVKGFQRFHAGEDVRPVTFCKLLFGSIVADIERRKERNDR